MFTILEKIWGAIGAIGAFFSSIWNALKTAFLFIASIWAAASQQIHAMPAWLQALCISSVVLAVVLIILLSR